MKICVFLGWFLWFGGSVFSQSIGSIDPVSLEIRNILESSTPESSVSVGEEKLQQYHELIEFYTNRAFAPVWPDGRHGHRAVKDLLEQIEDSK